MTHILIAEDKYDSRYLLKVLLEGNGYRVTVTSNGEEALAAARKTPPDVIVTDVLMPKMDGFELCRLWMSDDILRKIPFIFYSATYTNPEDINLALSLGAKRYIVKPQEAEILLSELQQVLQEWDSSTNPPQPALTDDNAFHTQHEAAMARKLRDKIEELEKTNLKLRASEEKYRGIYESLQDVYVETDINGTILDVSARITIFTDGKYTREDLIGKNIEAYYLDPRQWTLMKLALKKNGSVDDFEAIMMYKEGLAIPCSVSALLMAGESDKPERIACMFRDITERKDYEDKLIYLAQYDTLTDLPNRLLFKDRLKQAIIEADRHERVVGVVLLDIDRFKIINDTLGHEVGDHILVNVGKRLVNALRDGDTISRFSGDEFAVVLSDMSHIDDMSMVLGKITGVLSTPIMVEHRELFLTASIGVAIHPIDPGDSETLIRNADVAMHKAKETGNNTYQFYAEDMTKIAQEKLMLEEALQHAIEREELVLHYQPQVCLKSGEIIGMEALIRWNHAEQGLISPEKFIPIAEETGLILPIGEWVLHTATRQMKIWQTLGFTSLRIAVNLSSRQFQESNLLYVVKKVLDESSLDASHLELELTESMLLKNVDQTILTLNALRDNAVQISIDDFGTGYSSLSYLRKFPVSALKIDRSFVFDVNDDPWAASIVKTIINMAHTLGMKVIAEGVETLDQLMFLRTNNCNSIQGFYFSKPVPADEFTDLLQSKKYLSFSEENLTEMTSTD